MKKLGIYIHIPFCIQKCMYCDFCSFPKSEEGLIEGYVSALCRDIESRAADCLGYTVDTVYFGGGTPTLLPINEFERIIDTLRKNFCIDTDCEISSECNPATVDLDYLLKLREIGVNRLSIGLQSSNDMELRALGRIHSYSDFVSTYNDARKAEFENISADLMYGIPYQTADSFKKTLSDVVSLAPEHISAYGLKIEEGTPFFKMADELVLPDEDAEYEMYTMCTDFLAENGYDKYEISNFSRKGYECRHNIKYWNGDEYLGFGISAHSYFGGERFSNSRDIEAYIKGLDVTEERRVITPRERMAEYVMLRMRLKAGVEHKAFFERFGRDFSEIYGYRLEKYAKDGYVRQTAGNTFFSDKGFFVSNFILSDILDFEAL
ncbi:MAG: radical SAM family heme chaperone HemW [Clostridia bacterium]|nr:radical SAM family heme chaperone HemW [Clostridia bacterium]